MVKGFQADLSRRERQIMDILYANGPSTAADVQEGLPEAPSYSAVRAMLRVLEEKGHIEHEQDGPRYVYHPKVGRETASRKALKHVVQTFFRGNRAAALAALLDDESAELSNEEYRRLSRLVELAQDRDTEE